MLSLLNHWYLEIINFSKDNRYYVIIMWHRHVYFYVNIIMICHFAPWNSVGINFGDFI